MASVSISSSSLEEGPEYRAMRECNAMMVNRIKSSISSLGDELFAKRLIPLDVKERLKMIALTPDDKTREILDCIIRKVQYHPKVFHDLVDVLKKQDLQDVADQLLSCYQPQTATPQPSSSMTLSPSQGGSQHYTLPSDVIKMMVDSVRVTSLDQNQSVIQSSLRVERDNTQPEPNTDIPIPWTTDPKITHCAVGTREVLLLVSKVSGVNVVPRRNRPLLTEEEKHKLQEQGIHEDYCLNDLCIMTARYTCINNNTCTIAGILTGEQKTYKEVEQRITELFNTTDKQGVVLYYNGPGQMETGNWCFKDGFISFQEIMKLYMLHLKPRGRVLVIVSDCSYSGRWVKEAMIFMDGQGVGPCGHQAKEKGILVKVAASCLANEVPTELAFSTHCAKNDNAGTVSYYINHKEIYDNQHTIGLDFTVVQCNDKIVQPCTMAPQSTWQQWSDGDRTTIVRGFAKGQPAWHYLLLEDNEDKIKEYNEKRGGTVIVSDYGQILKSGWGKDPPEEINKWFKENYFVNYNYQPSPDTTD